VTGGSAQLPGLPERLSALVGVPVEPAYMHDLLRIGDIGFAPDELPRLEPYLPAPVGLALGGANVGTVIDLRPRSRGKAAKGGRGAGIDRRFVAAGLAGVVLLGGLTYLAKSSESSAQSKSNKAQAEAKKLRSQLYYEQQGPQTAGTSTAVLKGEVTSVLASDVEWSTILGDISSKLPPGVRLSSFTGTHNVETAPTATSSATTTGTSSTGSTGTTGTSGATGTGTDASGTSGAAAPAAPTPTNVCSAVTTPDGTISINGYANSVPAVAAFLDSLKKDTDLAELWVTTAKQGTSAPIEFTLTAQLGTTARGHRLESFFKEEKCK
jgi:hypothetical protein